MTDPVETFSENDATNVPEMDMKEQENTTETETASINNPVKHMVHIFKDKLEEWKASKRN